MTELKNAIRNLGISVPLHPRIKRRMPHHRSCNSSNRKIKLRDIGMDNNSNSNVMENCGSAWSKSVSTHRQNHMVPMQNLEPFWMWSMSMNMQAQLTKAIMMAARPGCLLQTSCYAHCQMLWLLKSAFSRNGLLPRAPDPALGKRNHKCEQIDVAYFPVSQHVRVFLY